MKKIVILLVLMVSSCTREIQYLGTEKVVIKGKLITENNLPIPNHKITVNIIKYGSDVLFGSDNYETNLGLAFKEALIKLWGGEEVKWEWEKIKGRFVELLFNEPVEQLLFFASKQLENIENPKEKITEFDRLNNEIIQSNLVNYSKSNASSLFNKLYPLDWLSANILVQSLQRYGQNERSLFTFLNDFSKSNYNSENLSFFNVNSVYDYLIQTLSSDIQNYNNPHRPQWLSSMRALERAELNFSEDYSIASAIIKTICLVNIFCKNRIVRIVS